MDQIAFGVGGATAQKEANHWGGVVDAKLDTASNPGVSRLGCTSL